MTDKFKNVPVKKIQSLNFEATKFENIDALHEGWYWEGVTAESLIFAEEDITHITRKS